MKLTEQSFISLSLAVAVVSLAYWTGTVVSKLETKVESHEVAIKGIKDAADADRKATADRLDRLSQDMADVKARLDFLVKLERVRP